MNADVIIIGAGLAGLSAAVYLARARREALVIDSGRSMARWEPDVQNYLGFPDGIAGDELLRRARRQARRYGSKFVRDEIRSAGLSKGTFVLRGVRGRYRSRRLLIATGIFHIPPDVPGIKPCLGHSMFFCKDCDGYRVQGKSVAIYGWTNETVEYALAMVFYSPCVSIVTDGHAPRWDRVHARWVREYKIPVYPATIHGVRRRGRSMQGLRLENGTEVKVDALFTTRGDIYFSQLAKGLGASWLK